MIALGLIASIVLASILLLALPKATSEKILIVGLVISLAVFPRNLVSMGESISSHVGIAQSVPTLTTYHFVIVVFFLYAALRLDRPFRISIPHFMFLIMLGISVLWVWSTTPALLSGILHISIALACWPIGARIAAFVREREMNARFLCYLLVGVLVFQLLLSCLQILGVPLPVGLSGGASDVLSSTGRVIGTLGNPANLSKVTFIVLLILLPMTASTALKTRKYALWGVLSAVILAALTISRANLLASVIALVSWILLTRSGFSLGRRIFVATISSVLILLFSESTINRFIADPEGSVRPMLIDVALEQLPRTLIAGVGPNSYVGVVGAWNPLTATGYPVHNFYLLTLIEFGLPLAILFILPFLHVTAKAVWLALSSRFVAPKATAFLVGVPGLVVITTTGYGMLASFALPLLVFAFGYFSEGMRQDLHPGPKPVPLSTSRLEGRYK